MAWGDKRFQISLWWSSLRGEQRGAIGVLGVCSVAAILFSYALLARHITSPFLIPRDALVRAQEQLTAQQREEREIEAMKTRDTDGDGLSDWSEQERYHTSPYIADSDSDGVPDSIELAQGTDPSCPAGRECRDLPSDIPPVVSASGTEIGAQGEGFGSTATLRAGTSAHPADAAQALKALPTPGTIDASQIRELFLKIGVATEKELTALPDTEILALYVSLYEETARQATSSSTSTSL